MPVSIISKTGDFPKLNWKKIKDLILGKTYNLSIALVDDHEMRRAEKISKHKKRANILSFAYSKHSGEILFNVPQIRREAKTSGTPVKQRLAYLYIHSLLHLTGYDHKNTKGAQKMANQEMRYMAKSGF